jgi:hypothetical protein
MGVEAWYYLVPYRENIQEALDSLREREFRAGRYFPAMLDLTFSLQDPPRGPGAQHASIAAAREEAAEDGTKSILDFERVSLEPAWDVITPLDPDMVDLCLGSVTPAREQLEEGLSCLFEAIDRGEGRYLLLYDDSRPAFILFLGYSFD